MKGSYVKIQAVRGGGKIEILRLVKITDCGCVFVDVNREYIGITKGVYGSPYATKPSNKREFDRAYKKIQSKVKEMI